MHDEDARASQPTEVQRRFADSSIADMLDDEGVVSAPLREFVVPGFIPRGISGLVVAPGGTGKGFFQTALGISLALGRRFGRFLIPTPRRALLISREDDRLELHRRIEHTLRAIYPVGLIPPNDRELLVANLGVVDLVGVRDGSFSDELRDATSKASEGASLICFDPLGRFLPRGGDPLNSQEGAAAVHHFLDQVVRETGAAVLLAHHTNKETARSGRSASGGSTGSMMLEDLSRLVVGLSRLDEATVQEYGLDPASRFGFVEVAITKQNYSGPLQEPLVFERVRGGALVHVPTTNRRADHAEKMLQVLAAVGEPVTREHFRELAKSTLDLGQRPADDLRGELVAKRRLRRIDAGGPHLFEVVEEDPRCP